MASQFKDYIGDGAYVDFDGYSVVLTTEDGLRATNTIVLEPEVLVAFERWVKRLREWIAAQQEEKGARAAAPQTEKEAGK